MTAYKSGFGFKSIFAATAITIGAKTIAVALLLINPLKIIVKANTIEITTGVGTNFRTVYK